MKSTVRSAIKQVPLLGAMAQRIHRRIFFQTSKSQPFAGSATYWEDRYASGGDSGVGSYDRFAEFKAEVLNQFVAANDVQTVIEFGCGDGNQLKLARYPKYLGFDVSDAAVFLCEELFKADESKSFHNVSEYSGQTADLTLSLDVIYHLVEDDVYENYMRLLFSASNRYVVIYSSDLEDTRGRDGNHIRHRKFTKWIQANIQTWNLVQHLPNRYPYRGDYLTGSFAEFFVYEKH